MMSDRELIELAARASGYVPGETFKFHPSCGSPMVRPGVGMQWVNWSPLTDGDSRRLQVKLRLGLVPVEGGGWDCVTWNHDEEVVLATDMDPNRAVLMAAAVVLNGQQSGQGAWG